MAKLLHPHWGQVSEDPCAPRSVFAAPPPPRVAFRSALCQMSCLTANPQGYGLALGCGDASVAHSIPDKRRVLRGCLGLPAPGLRVPLAHVSFWEHRERRGCNRCFESQPSRSGYRSIYPTSVFSRTFLIFVDQTHQNRSPAGTQAACSPLLPMPPTTCSEL